jgi:hypothetical protein
MPHSPALRGGPPCCWARAGAPAGCCLAAATQTPAGAAAPRCATPQAAAPERAAEAAAGCLWQARPLARVLLVVMTQQSGMRPDLGLCTAPAAAGAAAAALRLRWCVHPVWLVPPLATDSHRVCCCGVARCDPLSAVLRRAVPAAGAGRRARGPAALLVCSQPAPEPPRSLPEQRIPGCCAGPALQRLSRACCASLERARTALLPDQALPACCCHTQACQ